MMAELFADVCRRGGLKFNADRSKVMVLIVYEGMVRKILVDDLRLEHISDFKYFEGAEWYRMSWEGNCGNHSIVKDKQLECARMLSEALLVLITLYGSKTTSEVC